MLSRPGGLAQQGENEAGSAVEAAGPALSALLHGDCLDVLASLDAESIEACCTDPPYGLRFMGRMWDHGVPSAEAWAAVLRVLKPGAHLLAFGGTRTYHRLACAIEDAGFEIRDTLAWMYGQGFPKSLDVSKAIDKAAGAKGAWRQEDHPGRAGERVRRNGPSNFGQTDYGGQNAEGTLRHVYEPATEAARQWQGWGTALKPAFEPIVLARKPLVGTVAANVMQHGTGALNVDGCRIATDENRARMNNARTSGSSYIVQREAKLVDPGGSGRWPANVLLGCACDVEHEPGCAVRMLDEQSGDIRAQSGGVAGWQDQYVGGTYSPIARLGYDDSGGASRFFYTAKASRREREGSKHPTVKPLDLMRWLVRLVTPPGGTVLDPFAGTGTTGEAALMEGFSCVLIEREAEYVADIEKRLRETQLGLGV
jgi:DNA modification methylase